MITLDFLHGLGVRNLQQAGGEIRGSCPVAATSGFHKNKTDARPSWSINVETGVSFCATCEKGWSLWRIAVLLTGSEEAARQALAKASLSDTIARADRVATRWTPVQDYDLSRTKIRDPQYDRNLDIEIAVWADEPMPPYMAGRGFSDETCAALGIGFDRVRNRVTFPIYEDDLLVGIVGRTVLSTVQPKYWFYHQLEKGQYLYVPKTFFGEMRDEHLLFVVEGPTDAARWATRGRPFSMACCGAHATETQARKIIEASDNCGLQPVLCFDNDPAGRRAVKRTAAAIRGRVDRYDPLVFVYPSESVKDPGELPPDAETRVERFSSWLSRYPATAA